MDNIEQGKSEGFDICDRPSNLTKIGFKSLISQPVWPSNLRDDLKKRIGHLFYTMWSFKHRFKAISEFKLELESGNAEFVSKPAIFSLVWPIIQTWVTVQKLSIQVKINHFLSHVSLKFDGRPWKTIGHIFYAASNVVHHFIAISEFKLECIISSSNVNSNWSYSPERPNLGKKWWLFVSHDLGFWQMTLHNNRAPLLCYFKLCASFQSTWLIQTGVTVWKRLIWVKIDNFFFSPVTLKFDGWPSKSIGQLFLATSSFVYHFIIIICEFKLEFWSGND